MSKTLVPLAAAAAVLALAAALPAAAAPASPYDAGPVGTAQASVQVLPTSLFGLGIDLTSIGVDPSELATAGPVSSTSTPSSPNMLTVDDNGLDCPNAQFSSIQAAVTAASPGAMIKVCRGTYQEQVTIPAGKNGLTLFSVPDLQAVIKAPAAMTDPKAILRVNGAQNITIRHFTITGPGTGGCDSIRYGVRVDAGGSALITDNHITKIRDTVLSGCQNGVGVLIGRNFECTFGFGTVVHNLIDDYQKGGVVVDGELSTADCSGGGVLAPATSPAPQPSNAEVAYNEIDGIGPTLVIAQNGIQVSRGAIANVHHNVVRDNINSPATTTGEGILVYQDSSAQTTVHHNNVYNNTDGIGLYTTSNIEVGWNRSHDNVAYDGLFADSDTANNIIEHNLLFGNAEFDCNDFSVGTNNAPAFVANPWIQDLGYTENRPGLCKHASP
jgi:nitrous oxidase accessory protein NosD